MALRHTLFCHVDQLDFFIGGLTVWSGAYIHTCRWGWGWFLMVINAGFHSHDKRQCWRIWKKMASRHTFFCYVDQHNFFIGGSTVCSRACINTYRWGCGYFLMVITGGFYHRDKHPWWCLWKKMVSRHTLFYYVDKLFFFICRSTEKMKPASTHFVEDVVVFLCWSKAAFITMMNAMFWPVARWPIVNCC